MDNILVPKSSKQFACSICNYITSRESQYIRHLSTAKHKKITNGNNDGSDKFGPLTCKQCFQTFKYRSGLSRHKQKCVPKRESVDNEQKEVTQETSEILPEMSSKKYG